METQKSDRYPGLWPFGPEQANIFYGRDREKEELYCLSRSSQVVLLFSKSGVGKSSLLNAGIAPRFQEEGYLTASVLFTKIKDHSESEVLSPLDILKFVLRPFAGKKDIRFDKDNPRLWEYVKTIDFPKSTGLVLLFDQFEELFTYKPEEIREFLLQLAELIHDKPPSRIIKWLLKIETEDRTPEDLAWVSQAPVKFIFAIRSDRLAELQKVDEIIPGVFNNRYQLLPMDVENAKLAITNPAKKEMPEFFECEPFTYEKNALTKIIDNLKSEYTGEIEPAQLQIVCRYIEDLVKTSYNNPSNIPVKEITTDIFDANIEIDRVLHNYYEQQLAQVGNAEEQMLCRHLLENDLLEKINENYNRIRLSDGKVKARLGNNNDLLKKLLDSRLIKSEVDDTGMAYYQISHDSLKDPILESKKLTDEKEKIDKDRINKIEEAQIYIAEHYEYLKNKQAENALVMLKMAENIYDSLNESQGCIETGILIAKTFESLRDFDKAKQKLKESLSKLDPQKDKRLIGMIHECYGVICAKEGNEDLAFASFKNALETYEVLPDYQQMARLSEHLGGLKEELFSTLELDASNESYLNTIITENEGLYNYASKYYELINDTFGYERIKRSLRRLQENGEELKKRITSEFKPWGYLTELFTGKVYLLKGKDNIRIGRDVYNEATKAYTLKNEIGYPSKFNFMSRRHASISPNLVIEDTQSLNGTTINNIPLYYGNPKTLTDGDIIVLANIMPLRFNIHEPVKAEIPKNCWGLFVDGNAKIYHYLTLDNELYSLIIKQSVQKTSPLNHEFSFFTGESEDALIKYRMNKDKPEFFVQDKTEVSSSKNARNKWKVLTTVKDTDRSYKDYILSTGVWYPTLDFPMVPQLFAPPQKEGEKEILIVNGPSFQLIINPEFNRGLMPDYRLN